MELTLGCIMPTRTAGSTIASKAMHAMPMTFAQAAGTHSTGQVRLGFKPIDIKNSAF